jgi:hypothetical protein
MGQHQCLARLDDEWYIRLGIVKKILFNMGEIPSATDYAVTRYALEFLVETYEGLMQRSVNDGQGT